MNKIIFVVCLTIVAFLYLINNLYLNEWNYFVVVENILCSIGVYLSCHCIVRETKFYREYLSSSGKMSAFFFYSQDRTFANIKISYLHGIIPLAYNLASLFLFSFLYLNVEILEYYLILEVLFLSFLLLSLVSSIITNIQFVDKMYFATTILIGLKLVVALIYFDKKQFNELDLFYFLLAFIFLYGIFCHLCWSLDLIIKKYIQYKQAHIDIILSKHHPQVIIPIVNSQPEIQPLNKEQSFFVGDSKSKINITVVLNIFCKKSAYCVTEIYNLMEKHGESISLQFVFNFHIYRDDIQKNIIKSLLSKKDKEDSFKMLRACYISLDELKKHQEDGGRLCSKPYEKIIKYQMEWCKQHKIVEGPVVFVNFRKMPYNYSVSEVVSTLLNQ